MALELDRILVIRGGAIGDFILTLPALKALREAYPAAHIEILGYAHIAALAEGRFYANAVRSIEYGALSRFFARNAELPQQLADYFARFDLIISYLFDPDLIFRMNLLRAGAENIITGPAKPGEGGHAAEQLGRPMREDLGLTIGAAGATIHPNDEDRAAAANLLRGLPTPIVAFHPGSGSESKNWPLENWQRLGEELLGSTQFAGSLLLVTGEADEAQTQKLEMIWRASSRVRFARHLPLPHLAAALENKIFVGHDSGISHLAAAVGARCVLLFGPTDPRVWGPVGDHVTILRAPGLAMANIRVEDVRRELSAVIR